MKNIPKKLSKPLNKFLVLVYTFGVASFIHSSVNTLALCITPLPISGPLGDNASTF